MDLLRDVDAAAPGRASGRPAAAESLAALIRGRAAVVGVIGFGHVGLPLAISFAEGGFRVLGFDIDRAKVEVLSRGESPIRYLDAARVRALLDTQKLAVTADFDRLPEADVVIICVPTPLTPQRVPDLSAIVSAGERIAHGLRRGQLVVLESTTYPGTTEELLAPVFAAGGLTCGEDFFLAYSPARVDPGNERFAMTAVPKVVGGHDEVSGDLAQELYDAIFAATVRLSSLRAAEATKLLENVFRAVNIALVNELKVVYDRMGIDIWEVLDAAETKPFGFMRFNPGPGWGGHCIPLDPFYLSWKAREYGVSPHFIELAGEVNVRMPHFVIGKLAAALNERERAVKGSRVLLLGISYKRDIGDLRESPAFEILRLLREAGAIVTYHDPHIPAPPPALESVPLTVETVSGSDAVILVTDHSAIDYEWLARHAKLIVDTRGVYRRPADHIVKA
jgi:UDP-N-acetyl-D-glucosamine dehydrogenase